VQVRVDSSGSGEGPDPQLVVDEIRGAREGMDNILLFRERNASVASKIENGPTDLDVADSFQSTYLEPLRIFNTVIKNLANVWATLLGRKRANQVA
jgi:hypothetical protein